MGRKVGSKKILALALVLCGYTSSHASVSWLQSTLTDSMPLMTDRVLDFDPEILNPHRVRVVYKRTIQVNGLAAVPHPAGSGFTVRVLGIDSHVLIGMRDRSSPLFSTIEEFPCTAKPDDRYATYEQTVLASQKKAAHWHQIVKNALPKIEMALESVREPVESMAEARAKVILGSWTKRLQNDWMEWDRIDSRAAEWKYYQTEAQKLTEPCKYKSRGFKPWSEIMDPVPENPRVSEPLSRSPARRVGKGEWTIRLGLSAANLKLSGQFLVDPESSFSTVSPDWLSGQGMEEFLIEDPGKRIVKIKRREQTKLAKIVVFPEVEASGQKIGIEEFGIMDSDEYKPPEDFDVCCDGILGVDFFRKNVVQFDSSAPLGGVLIWPRSNYRAPTGYSWKEFGVEGDGSLPSHILSDLKSNTPMIVDLPHGRVWYPPQMMPKPKPKRSGLVLKFMTEKNARVLKVMSIDPKSKAGALIKQGIAVGMNIQRIADFTVRYLNQWTIDEILKGSWGDEIVIEYRTKDDQPVKVKFTL